MLGQQLADLLPRNLSIRRPKAHVCVANRPMAIDNQARWHACHLELPGAAALWIKQHFKAWVKLHQEAVSVGPILVQVYRDDGQSLLLVGLPEGLHPGKRLAA